MVQNQKQEEDRRRKIEGRKKSKRNRSPHSDFSRTTELSGSLTKFYILYSIWNSEQKKKIRLTGFIIKKETKQVPNAGHYGLKTGK